MESYVGKGTVGSVSSPSPSLSSFTVVRNRSRFLTVSVLILLLILIMYVVVALTFDEQTGNLLQQDATRNFVLPVKEAIGVAVLSPIVVSIFERPRLVVNTATSIPSSASAVTTAATTAAAAMSTAMVDKNSIQAYTAYTERLIVIRPNNWLVYTANGITFHYITNNVNESRIKCTVPGALNAIVYRLQTIAEASSDNVDDKTSRRLRFSCVNYTMDQLTRVFGRESNRTDIDLTDYFDSSKTSDAPELTVANVLDLLIVNAYV